MPIAREVFERFQHSPERTPAHRLAFEAPTSLEVRCDSTRIDQIMSNLLSNALKYSEGGEVALRLAREGSEAVIAVSDQGVGIPEGDRERIFQPFYRSDVARSSASGSGLGLYITKQIVEQHGGAIAVASAPGGGTVFTVRLPLSRDGD
ncbi:MAG: HAMP domain-containing histidine kinase [Thermomicrobiaceae bacterium]|nr:HAMP domain-containing histidine kinase [Thermomicrobiaceae bacterium]